MRVGIDVRSLASKPYTGVANVARHLLPALFALAPHNQFVLYFVSDRDVPHDVALWEGRFSNVHILARRIPGRIFDVAMRFFPYVIWDYAPDCDVLFSPNINLVRTKAPRVVVVHDLSFVRYPEFLSPLQRYWHWLMVPKKQAKAAEAIVVPSFATKQDMVRLWGIAEGKIHVVQWGAPIVRVQSSRIRYQENPYILSVGTVEPRKNFLTLVRAFGMLNNKKARLLLVGPWAQGMVELKGVIANSSARDRIELKGFVSEEEKEKLLSAASIFVYPSLLEGFGLPVLEAMSAGVPVIASNRSSLPEVVGDAGVLADPWKAEEIAAAIDAILDDFELAQELSQRGKERAKQFSWERAAQQTLEILREAAKSRA